MGVISDILISTYLLVGGFVMLLLTCGLLSHKKVILVEENKIIATVEVGISISMLLTGLVFFAFAANSWIVIPLSIAYMLFIVWLARRTGLIYEVK